MELTGTSTTIPISTPPFSSPINVPIGLIAGSLTPQDLLGGGADVSPQNGGDAGDLTINTGRLLVQGGATVSASTVGQGQGGNLTVNASDSIKVSGTSARGEPGGLRNGARGIGPGGDLTINTGRLIIQDGAWVTAGTSREGQGGDLTVNALDSVELIGTDSVNGIPSVLVAGTKGPGDAGDLTINTRRLIVRDGAVVSAGTSSDGPGGDLTVNASDSVKLIGTASVAANRAGFEAVTGIFDLAVFRLVEGGPVPSGLITGTGRTGSAGNLTINTGRLVVQDGAQASIFTVGSSNAGTLTVRASEVELTGTSKNDQSSNAIIGPSLLTTAVSLGATGNGGDLKITTGRLVVRDGAAVNVSSQGTGNAGNLEVAARSIRLDGKATLSSNTTAGQGNIFLNSQDLVLRRGSNITANATGTVSGGNITIDTGVLAALENSDISADAPVGSGGQIVINAQGIFGTEPRDALTPESDITATGAISGGTITINNPDVDPTQGLVELPAELVDVSNSIAQGCPEAVWRGESKFIITGRGGLPPNPNEPLRGDNTLTNWSTLDSDVENRSSATPATNSTIESAPTTIVEANGWVKSDNGEVVLTATAPTATPDIPWLPNSDCHAPEPES